MERWHNNQIATAFVEWPVYMQRALDLASRVISATPNPRVGCVIVNDGDIAGEGWHAAAGQDHAEVMALKQAGTAAQGATAFVSLEPCAHVGRTNPCCDALIAAGIRHVVIASLDPNPQVAGGGVARLEAAGCQVYQLLEFEKPARTLNSGYFKRREAGLPWVRLKLAMSLDGRTALASGASKWITGTAARADVQRLRAASSAIMTGINTVLADDPALTVRADEIAMDAEELAHNSQALQRPPLRAIVDSQLRTPGTARIFQGDGNVLIYSRRDAGNGSRFPTNATLRQATAANHGVDLRSVLESLAGEFECNDVLVEAGPILSGALLKSGLVDELIVYLAPRLLGSDARPLLELTGLSSLSQTIDFQVTDLVRVGEDVRISLKPADGSEN